MAFSDNNVEALLLDLHQIINDYSKTTSQELFDNSITDLAYPPNTQFSEAEKTELAKLAENDVLKNALQKIIADNSASVLFGLFNHIDGTTDPAQGNWTGVRLVDISEENQDTEMLHDKFFETFWDWKEAQ